ncbi:hypothetical protein [Nocardia sp. NPDC058480]|uniref:hypothetical protein n=1 Tax=unclassified Nocardia TaxID=2637762 RepID=UPI0036590965
MPRASLGAPVVVLPRSDDLEFAQPITFNTYDLDDGDTALAAHFPAHLDGCPSFGYDASVVEDSNFVDVTLVRGLHRGMQPCDSAQRSADRGVVVVVLGQPLGDRAVRSMI